MADETGQVRAIFDAEIAEMHANVEPSSVIDWLVGLRDRVLATLSVASPRQGWDCVEGRPTLVMTYRLFEEDHGLRCPRCQREVLRGQPYEAILDGMTEDGEPFSELVCVYCAPPADKAASPEQGNDSGNQSGTKS